MRGEDDAGGVPCPRHRPVPEEFALLVSAFAAITDPRLARGKVHPLPGVLALVVLGA